MRTTIDIDDDLLRRAKERAHREKRTLRALFEEVLRDALSARPVRRKKFKLKDASFRGTGLRPGIKMEDMIELSYGEWGQ
ncbi:MAG: DUF2191 domain-containing protein [Planctomycetes bacterium]|nr:DUF2191 domain-containing protein [Planctomycetota bacterium]